MLYKRHGMELVCMAIMLNVGSNALAAFSASDLPGLRKTMIAACPAIWEPMASRVLYVSPGDPQDVVGEPYVVAGEDIWAGNRFDKIRYIAFAFEVLAPNHSDVPVMDYASYDGAIITACRLARRDYFETQMNIHYVHPDLAQGILDTVRDDDNDGVFNDVDECLNTTNEGITEGTGKNSIGDDYAVDETGCAAWERDEDGDGVSDQYDYCFGSDAQFAVVGDGCIDTDDDGQSDRVDPYPHQNDTQCTP
jgi:hypothetical protein